MSSCSLLSQLSYPYLLTRCLMVLGDGYEHIILGSHTMESSSQLLPRIQTKGRDLQWAAA